MRYSFPSGKVSTNAYILITKTVIRVVKMSDVFRSTVTFFRGLLLLLLVVVVVLLWLLFCVVFVFSFVCFVLF